MTDLETEFPEAPISTGTATAAASAWPNGVKAGGTYLRHLETAVQGSNKLDTINAEVQLQFRKLRGPVAEKIAKKMAKMTTQLTEELSHAREQLTQARRELEDTRLQLQTMKEAQEAPLVRPAYADVARRTPPASVPSLAPSASRIATPEPAFCAGDMTRVPEEYIGEVTPMAFRKLIENECERLAANPCGVVLLSPETEQTSTASGSSVGTNKK